MAARARRTLTLKRLRAEAGPQGPTKESVFEWRVILTQCHRRTISYSFVSVDTLEDGVGALAVRQS